MNPFKKSLPVVVLILVAAALAGCNKKQENAQTNAGASSSSAPSAKSGVVALVNGQPITQQMFDAFARERQGQQSAGNPQQERSAIIDTLVNLRLLAQEAVKQGLDKNPEMVAEMKNDRISLLARAVIQQQLKDHPLTDESLKKEYDARIQKMSMKEYKARHILTTTETEAQAVIAQLNKGANFATLAKEKSIDTSSAQNGGELGWFSPDQMVKPFAEAVEKLKKGSYTQTPVHTQYGWHVILLQDVRAVQPPPFDEVKDQVRSIMQNRIIGEYIDGLRKKAKIQIEQK